MALELVHLTEQTELLLNRLVIHRVAQVRRDGAFISVTGMKSSLLAIALERGLQELAEQHLAARPADVVRLAKHLSALHAAATPPEAA